MGDENYEPELEPNPEARQWAMFAHLASFAGYTGIPMANILGPLIVWMMKKEEFPFVDDQGKEAINFQISMTIYILVGVATFCIGIGIVVVPALAILDLVFTIIAAIQVNTGKAYRYPLTIRLIT
jgi:hypothetical protein